MVFDRVRRLGPFAQGSLFYLGFYSALAAYMPFISIYFADQGLTGGEIGLLSGIGPLMSLLVGPALTALADRRGWRVRMLVFGLAASAVIMLAIPLPGTFWGLLPIMALLAAFSSGSIPIADGILARLSARRNFSYGQMRVWGSVSWVVVAPVGGVLWQQIGLFWMFVLASVLFLATVAIARLLPEETPTEAKERKPLWAAAADPRLRVLLGASFVLGLGTSMSATFTGVHLDRISGGQALVGIFAGVAALCELPVMAFSERIIKRLGGPLTLLLACAFQGSAYLALGLIAQPEFVLLAAVLRGLGFGLLVPSTVRMVSSWAPPEWSSTYQGLLSAAVWGLAPLIAGPLGGAIFDAAGSTLFLVSAVAAAIAVLIVAFGQVSGVFRRGDEQAEAARQAALAAE